MPAGCSRRSALVTQRAWRRLRLSSCTAVAKPDTRRSSWAAAVSQAAHWAVASAGRFGAATSSCRHRAGVANSRACQRLQTSSAAGLPQWEWREGGRSEASGAWSGGLNTGTGMHWKLMHRAAVRGKCSTFHADPQRRRRPAQAPPHSQQALQADYLKDVLQHRVRQVIKAASSGKRKGCARQVGGACQRKRRSTAAQANGVFTASRAHLGTVGTTEAL